MARKNLLDLTLEQNPLADSGLQRRASGAPAIGGLRDTIRDLSANGVQEVDVNAILASQHQDRITIDDSDIADLVQSIRAHGQQVPVLLRPIRGQLNQYEIVYGRRRLAAIRSIGGDLKVRAIIRTLDDEAAILAQGQENNLRKDPSFIEKALFVRSLREAGYSIEIIQDALGINRQGVYRHAAVSETIPAEVICRIGAAHDVGRRPWTEVSSLIRDHALDAGAIADTALAEPVPATAEERFAAFRLAVIAATQKNAAPQHEESEPVSHGRLRSLRQENGQEIGSVKPGSAAVTLKLATKDSPAFGQWLTDNAEDIARGLLARWRDESRRQG